MITWQKFSEQGPAWLLAALLCLVFFTGGSSWISEPQLMVLRPAALVLAALGVLTFRLEHLTGYWVVWALFLGALGLTVLHLVPMPFEWWSKLPGRGIIVEIDEVVGLGKIWRPLSMSPDSTLHALLSLSVPFAVLLLAVQLTDRQHQYMLGLVLGLAGLSGAVGLLQASGSQIEFYPLSTPVYVARVDKVFCSDSTGRCTNADRRGVYYYDDDHLSNAGARLVAPIIVDAIKAANHGRVVKLDTRENPSL